MNPEPSSPDRYTGRVLVGVYLFLVMLFSLVYALDGCGQTPSTQKLPAITDSPIPELKIGDTIPAELWSLPQAVVNHPDGKKTITLDSFRDKLVIVDFWATWCVSCLASLSKLDSLQQSFGEQLTVLPVTYEPAGKAGSLFSERGWKLLSISNDKILKKYFPHRFVPHQVWIKSGKVIAITSSKESSADNIEALLKSGTMDVKQKKDILNYNGTGLLSLYARDKGSALLYNSSFTGYIEGLGTSEIVVDNDSVRVINFNNRRPLAMFKAALKIPHNQILVEIKPDLREHWIYSKSRYCYQLRVPKTVDEGGLKEKILNDLAFIFQVKWRYETRKRKCLFIRRMSGKDALAMPDNVNNAEGVSLGPFHFSQFIEQLNFSFNWEPALPVIIDESGYSGQVTLDRPFKSLKNLASLNQVLQRYNLKAAEGFTTQKVYVLTDLN